MTKAEEYAAREALLQNRDGPPVNAIYEITPKGPYHHVWRFNDGSGVIWKINGKHRYWKVVENTLV